MEQDSGKTMIELRKVSKWYNQFQALKEVSLTVKKGERVVICGPSGSGKSTLIRCINHLEPHQEGQILVEGVELTDANANGPVQFYGRHCAAFGTIISPGCSPSVT